jgi:hypothetical protein
MTIIRTLSGWRDIDTSPAALTADALACERAHADRIAAAFARHASCAWQQAGPDWDDLPTDAPGDDDPTDGPSERAPRFDGTRASWLARQRWAQARWKAVA